MAARRTVSVALEVKAAESRKQIKGLRDEAAALDKSAREAGRGLDKMAENANQAGRASEKAAAKTKVAKIEAEAYKRELGSLDRQIDATVLHLKVLGREFEATGDKATLGKISAERAMLRRLQQIRKDVTPDVPSGGGGFAPPVSPILVAAIVAAVAAVAPGLGAIIGGATLGGIGAGGIVGGVIAASHDGRVKDAFSAMGQDLKASFFETGRPFLGPLLHDTAQLQATAGSAINILRKGFNDLAPVLHPLVLGLDGFVEALGPGMDSAFKAAKPLLRAFANELPRIGDAISGALSDIAGGSEGGVEGMVALTRAIESFIRGTGAFIRSMEDTYAWLVRNTAAAADFGLTLIQGFPLLKPIADKLHDISDQTHGYMDAAKAANDASNDFSYSLDGTADSADQAAQKVKDAAQKVEDYKKALEDLFNIQMSLDEANIRYQESIDKTLEILKDGKRTLDINTDAGRENKQAILDQLQAIENLRKARIDNGMTIADANKLARDEQEALRITAERLGFNKRQVDALTRAYENIPAKVSTETVTPGLTAAQSRLAKVEATLNRLDGRSVKTTITQEFISYRHDEVASSRRWGGISEREAGGYAHAAVGRLRDAAIYSTRSPARYAFAEPSTGGEAFVPKYGPYGRAMSTLSHAAGWYGASVVPGGGYMRAAGSAPVIVQVNVSAGGGASQLAQALVSTLRTEVKQLGGDVQSALGSRIRVGG